MTTMKTYCSALLLALLLLAGPAVAGVNDVRRQVEASMLVTGSIEVDAQGAVTGYTLDMPASCRSTCAAWSRRWCRLGASSLSRARTAAPRLRARR